MSDARRLELQKLVRSCVQCALCLPHCATWLETGNEVHSPRGRLLLLEDVLKEDTSLVPDDYLTAFDHCIGCRACESMCPSGVPFSILEYGQEMAAGKLRQVDSEKALVPEVLVRSLDSTMVLKGMRVAGEIGRMGMQLVGGRNWRQKFEGRSLGSLARLLGSLPESPEKDRYLIHFLDTLIESHGHALPLTKPPVGSRTESGQKEGPTVSFFHGCASAHLLPGTSSRMRDILKMSGFTIEEPKHQSCCGALADHTGRPGTASAQGRAFQETFHASSNSALPILVEAAGCSHHLRKSEVNQKRVVDAMVFLSGVTLPPMGNVPLKVVYHDPCHALHGQGIKEEPRQLLRKIPGLQLLEANEADVCCGSGGAWGLRHPELSADLARRKAGNLVATGAELVVTSNPGCLGQIADGLSLEAPELPILPLSDLLWYALWQGTKAEKCQ